MKLRLSGLYLVSLWSQVVTVFFFFFLLHFRGEKAAFLFPTYCNQMNIRVTNDACMRYGSLILTSIAVTTVTYCNERNIKVTNTKEAKRRDSDPH